MFFKIYNRRRLVTSRFALSRSRRRLSYKAWFTPPIKRVAGNGTPPSKLRSQFSRAFVWKLTSQMSLFEDHGALGARWSPQALELGLGKQPIVP